MSKIIAKRIVLLLSVFLIGIVTYVQSAQAAGPKLSVTKKTIYEKNTFTLKLKKLKGRKSVKWKTTNKAVAGIKKLSKIKCRVTGKKEGTATITVKVGKRKYKCAVTVKKRESNDTDTKEPATGDDKQNAGNNGSADKVDKVDKNTNVAASQEKLRQYILNHGSLNQNGNRFIKVTTASTALGIVYDGENGSFKFLFIADDDCTTEVIFYPQNPNSSSSFIYTTAEYDSGFMMIADFTSSKYDGSDIAFDVDSSYGLSIGYENMNKSANNFLRLGFKGWDAMLESLVGIHMSDIGFVKYHRE